MTDTLGRWYDLVVRIRDFDYYQALPAAQVRTLVSAFLFATFSVSKYLFAVPFSSHMKFFGLFFFLDVLFTSPTLFSNLFQHPLGSFSILLTQFFLLTLTPTTVGYDRGQTPKFALSHNTHYSHLGHAGVILL